MHKSLQSLIAVLLLAISLAGCDSEKPVSIGALKEYVVKYQPCKNPGESCIRFPRTPEAVAVVLRRHAHDEEYKRYVTLFLLKLYRAHLEHYRQSYEVRPASGFINIFYKTDPMLKAFASFSDADLAEDYVGSDLGYEWVLKQPALLADPLIAPEVARIKVILSDIEAQMKAGEAQYKAGELKRR